MLTGVVFISAGLLKLGHGVTAEDVRPQVVACDFSASGMLNREAPFGRYSVSTTPSADGRTAHSQH